MQQESRKSTRRGLCPIPSGAIARRTVRRRMLLLVALRLHIPQTQILLLGLCPLVVFDLDLWVWLWRGEALNIAARKRVSEHNGELVLAVDSSREAVEESGPLLLRLGVHRVAAIARIKDGGFQVVADLCQETFNGGEPATKRTRLDTEIQFRARHGT